MKRILIFTFLSSMAMVGQTVNYTPTRMTLATSSDGGNTFTPLAMASAIGAVNYTPSYIVPMCSATGTPPFTQCSFSGGGGGNTGTGLNGANAPVSASVVGTNASGQLIPATTASFTSATAATPAVTASNSGNAVSTVAYNSSCPSLTGGNWCDNLFGSATAANSAEVSANDTGRAFFGIPGGLGIGLCVVNGTNIGFTINKCGGLTVQINPTTGAASFGAGVSASTLDLVGTPATAAAGHIQYGGAVSADNTNCGGATLGATGCIEVNVAGTTHWVPYF